MPERGATPRRLQIALIYLLALVVGVGSAGVWLTQVGIAGVDTGAWRVNLLAGSRDADAYTRARIALGAVLALDRSETLYYTTDRDETGEPLRAECRYVIEGSPPPARWWSITAYGADHFLFPNPQRRYSINSETAQLDSRGRFRATIGPATMTGAEDTLWIPTSGEGGMRLTLRLYGPEETIQRAPQSLDPPRLRREGDCS